MVTAVESWQTWAWLWPRRCPRQGYYRGLDKDLVVWPGKGLAVASRSFPAVVPGKDLAGGLVDFLGKDLAEDRRLLVLI